MWSCGGVVLGVGVGMWRCGPRGGCGHVEVWS